jgi:DmsE family decaheme c-type cytochrome
MFQLKRYVFLILALSACLGDAHSQSWMNDLLVHRTPSFTEGGAESCLSCHSGEKMRAVSKGAHGNLENPLTPFAQNECESCHGPGSIHVSRAHGGKGYPPLTIFGYERGAATRDEQVEACLNCHTDESSGIKVTPFHGTLHDKWIVNCSSCHQAHVEKDPVLERRLQAEVCLACHMNQKTEHRKVGKRVPDFDRMGCAGCHRVHRLPKSEKSED